jgi:hypothetical protein
VKYPRFARPSRFGVESVVFFFLVSYFMLLVPNSSNIRIEYVAGPLDTLNINAQTIPWISLFSLSQSRSRKNPLTAARPGSSSWRPAAGTGSSSLRAKTAFRTAARLRVERRRHAWATARACSAEPPLARGQEPRLRELRPQRRWVYGVPHED